MKFLRQGDPIYREMNVHALDLNQVNRFIQEFSDRAFSHSLLTFKLNFLRKVTRSERQALKKRSCNQYFMVALYVLANCKDN
jgi:hypothetical protein